MTLYYIPQYKTTTLATVGGIDDTITSGIKLQSVDGIDITKPGMVCLSYSNPLDIDKAEYIPYTSIDGTNTLVGATRGGEGISAKPHAFGVTCAYVVSKSHINNLNDALVAEHSVAGVHDATKVAMLAGTQIVTGDKTFSGAVTFTGAVSGVAAFWANVPGTPTRVSDTQFTITDNSNAAKYDLLFKKGVVLKWMESTTFQTAMVISSSYGTNTVTINIVGDSLTAGFTAMQYAIPKALKETFIIPGTIAAGTDIAKTWYTPSEVYILSADAFVKTAGTTNPTVFDINIAGTTKFTTKPSIASAATSDIDNVADTPSTSVAVSSLVTVDVDSVSTTAPVEAYVDVYYYPVDWRYR